MCLLLQGRETGDAKYLDYIGLNYHNGILAQQNRKTGMVAYYLPMQAGAHVNWGTPTGNFWCCHGTLVQIHNSHGAYMAYRNEHGVLLAQLFPGKYDLEWNGRRVAMEIGDQVSVTHYAPNRPDAACRMGLVDGIKLAIDICDEVEFDLMLRLPGWASEARISIDGELAWRGKGGVVTLRRNWKRQSISVDIPAEPRFVTLPDESSRGMLVYGYDVLAGITDDDVIHLRPAEAAKTVARDNPGEIMQGVPAWRLYDGVIALLAVNSSDSIEEVVSKFKREFGIELSCEQAEEYVTKPVIVRHCEDLKKSNARLHNQKGTFLICGNEINNGKICAKLKSLDTIKPIDAIRIYYENKSIIRNELDIKYGLNNAVVYPELPPVASYIKEK